MILRDIKFTQKDGEELVKEGADDLTAYYQVLQSAVFELMKKAKKENWTPDELVNKIDMLFVDKGEIAEPKENIENEFDGIVEKRLKIQKQCKMINNVLRKYI